MSPPASASPKTRMPPRMHVTFAAVDVHAMTGTASPSWKPRAEARKASTDASTATGSHGDRTSESAPSPATPVSALSATSETPNSVPGAAQGRAPLDERDAVGAAVLAEEAELGQGRAGEREDESKVQDHRRACLRL